MFLPVGNEPHEAKILKAKQLLQSEQSICCIVLHDNTLDSSNQKDILWNVLNNYNPLKDCTIEQNCLIIDGSSKIEQEQLRDWPMPVTSDNATITLVDEKWGKLGLGEPLESPSLRYKKLFQNDSAWRYR